MTEGMPVASGPGGAFTAAIANGQSLSGAIDLGTKRLARVDIPAQIDGTSMTFQVSTDGQNWTNLYQADGTEYSLTIAGGRGVVPDLTMFAGARYVKLRTGTSGAATPQTADRVITGSSLA